MIAKTLVVMDQQVPDRFININSSQITLRKSPSVGRCCSVTSIGKSEKYNNFWKVVIENEEDGNLSVLIVIGVTEESD